MLALYELPGGYALLRVVEGGGFKLVKQQLFKDSEEAVDAAKSLMSSELHGTLKKFLKKAGIQEELAVADAKLGGVIKKKLDIPCIHNADVDEIMRKIREQITELVEGLTDQNMLQMSLGLAHTLNRHVLKFSAEKIDVMVIQAIGLLDDLDKELNTYAMRVKEWYGWHFPEMAKILQDNLQYARIILKMGVRENAASTDLSDVIPEDLVAAVRDAAIHSMGVGLTEEDITNIKQLCEEVISTSEYRGQLFEYLKNRMTAIAPNLTTMVGELVGARLISHAGSLMNLAKAPASTVQILGAEKALFRALKQKQKTPKYGLIYHASLVGQAPTAHKGKIARIAACRAALATRVDALAEDVQGPTIGVEGRESVEFKLRKLEGTHILDKADKGIQRMEEPAYSRHEEQAKRPEPTTEKPFRITEDGAKELTKEEKKKRKREAEEAGEEPPAKKDKKDKKEKKEKKKAEEA
jgi:nucleolar protein 58